MQEEQYRVRGMFQEAAPPSGKQPVTVPAIMPRLSGTPGQTKWAGVSSYLQLKTTDFAT